MRNVLFIACLLLPGALQAQVVEGLSAIASLGGAVTGKQLLDRADGILNNRIAQIDQAANGLLNRSVNEMNVLASAARLNFADAIATPIGQLSGDAKTVMIGLRDAIAEIEKGIDRAYTLEEIVNIDVANRLGGLPLVKSAVFISSVRGLAALQREDMRRITVLGTGMGPGSADRQAKVKFFWNGKELVPDRLDCSTANTCSFDLKTQLFASAFKPKAVAQIDLVVQLNVTDKGTFGLGAKNRQVNAHVLLSLFSDYAGAVTLRYAEPIWGWKFLERRTQMFTSADCGAKQCGDGGRTQAVTTDSVPIGESASPVKGARKVENPGISCGAPAYGDAGTNCRYFYIQSVKANPAKTAVNAQWQATGAWVTMYVSYDLYEWSIIREEPREQSQDLYFEKSFDFTLPEGVTYFVLRGSTVTKQLIELTPKMSAPGVLTSNGDFAQPNGSTRYAYKVERPR